MSELTDPVLFDERPVAGGRRLAFATLHAPAALNALSLGMVRALAERLRRWEADPAVVGVVLDAAGDKAFCAGGDLRRLHHSLRAHGASRNPDAEAFFGEEYVLDHLVHTFPKPVVAWAHGIVMGGGVGLMAGASHRVVTESTRLAMPEVQIGLFPDVGGSWFLRRMPGRLGLFLALTAAPLGGGDAVHGRLADAVVAQAAKADVIGALLAAPWEGDAAAQRRQVSEVIDAARIELPAGPLQSLGPEIERLVADVDLGTIAARLRAVRTDDPWLRTAVDTFQRGCPTSAALAVALWERAEGLSLADVLRMEYRVALGCCAHADFPEGIRALLVDKDRRPRWAPAALEAVTAAHVDDHFRERGPCPTSLAALA